MKMTLSTPLAVVLEADQVAHVRAEDETGAFGILPGHADFLTALSLSVVTWRDGGGQEHHFAVRGGVLEVAHGHSVVIATREAVVDDDLHRLETEVLTLFRTRDEEDKAARSDERRLYLSAMRQIFKLLEPHRGPPGPGSLHARTDGEVS